MRKGAGPFDVAYAGASADGSHVFFTTTEQLTSDDIDASVDLYERFAGATKLVSTGPVNGNGAYDAVFAGVSSDGTRAFFTTAEKLTGDDGDAVTDIYQRTAGVTTRVSSGQINGSGPLAVYFGKISTDGSRVFFTTKEKLTSDDSDAASDVYERKDGTTIRLSKGDLSGNGAYDAQFAGASADGTRAFVYTSEKLVDADSDAGGPDIYQRSAGVTTLLTVSESTADQPYGLAPVGNSADGKHVYWITPNKMVEDDVEPSPQDDIYERFDGHTRLVSGTFAPPDPNQPPYHQLMFMGASADGAHVFFQTDEKITPDDQDNYIDVFERFGGTTWRISGGPDPSKGNLDFFPAMYRGASTDGTRVFFETSEQLTPDDQNAFPDVYRWEAGMLTHISQGPHETAAPGYSQFGGTSADGSRVFFVSNAQMTDEDSDASDDVYERSGLTTTLISKGQVNGNNAFDVVFRGASADGSKVFFTTKEILTTDDGDGNADLYQRAGATTTRLSGGELKGNGPFPASAVGSSLNGGRLFLTSGEQLTNDDVDSTVDLFERYGPTTTLLSGGEINGQGPYAPTFRGASTDGTKIFFTSAERLASGDADDSVDLFMRAGGSTAHVSAGDVNGDLAYDATFAGASADGSKVFFTSAEQLTFDDTVDSRVDIYAWSAGSPGTTTRVSEGPFGGDGDYDATFRGNSANGSKVFFTTAERLVSDDDDSAVDVYEWTDGVGGTWLSRGPGTGNSGAAASFAGASADGGKVFFTTAEKLTADDKDSSVDVYQRAGGVTTRMSQGTVNGNGAFPVTFAGASADGARVFFATAEKLASDDADTQVDVYQRYAGATTRISRGEVHGNGAYPATYVGASSDGASVFFTSAEQLTADDTDASVDVYRRATGTTSRVSRGAINGNGAFPATFAGASADGTRVFFTTDERLTGDDTDSVRDVYERYGTATTRISQGAINGNGAFPATYRLGSSDGKRVFFETAEKLSSADADSVKDVYSALAP